MRHHHPRVQPLIAKKVLPPSSEPHPNFLSLFFESFATGSVPSTMERPPRRRTWSADMLRGHRPVWLDSYTVISSALILLTTPRQPCLLCSSRSIFGPELMFVLLRRNYYTSEPRNRHLATFEKTNFDILLGCANLRRTPGAS